MRLHLLGACAKLGRAVRHLNELGDEMQALAEMAAGNLTLAEEEVYSDPRGYRHVVRVGALLLPRPRVALIVGDYIQNVRAALDHLARELVRTGSESQRKDSTAVQFPIYSIGRTKLTGRRKPRTFHNRVSTDLPGITDPQRALIDSYQPYHRGNWHLSALANLSNQDKHRIITPVRTLAGTIERRHLGITKGAILSWTMLLAQGSRLNPRTPFLEVIGDAPDAQVEMYAGIETLVAFQEGPGRYHRPRALEEIGEKVAEIVGAAARTWGDAVDAGFCDRWAVEGRKALGISD